jgi:putative RecB family exonuclease
MGLPVPRTLSPSKISLFKECALAFRYSAIDRVEEPPSVAATRGTLVHRALERLHLDPAAQRSRDRAGGHLAAAWEQLSCTTDVTGLGLDEVGRAELLSDADGLLDRYFTLEDPTTVRPIGLEVMLAADVGNVRIRGILDRLELDEAGELVVTDYKTGRSPSVYDERTRLLGVTVYAYLCEAVLGQRPRRVQLLYLANSEAIIAEPNEQALRGLRNQIGAIWDTVIRACRTEDFRPRPSRRCDWCGYKPICPAHGGDGPPVAGRNPDQLALFDVWDG